MLSRDYKRKYIIKIAGKFVKNIKETITYFKDGNKKSKKKDRKNKMLTTLIKSIHTSVLFTTTSTSGTISAIRIGLVVISLWTGIACGMTISKKQIY